MKTKKKPTYKSKDTFATDGKANLDAKLSKAAIVFEYAFEYGVNFKERTIQLSGDIDQEMFNKVDAAMTEMESDSRKTITLKINSLGGDTYQAMAIIGRMDRSACRIVTEGYGHIMSAATLILASGDLRRMSKRAQFMHHEATIKVKGRLSAVMAEVAQTKVEEDLWNQWMADVTKTPKKLWSRFGVGKDKYITAEKLLELGVVDELF